MVQRKYLIIFALVLLPTYSQASAWLTPANHSRISYSHQKFNHSGRTLAKVAEEYYFNQVRRQYAIFNQLDERELALIKSIDEEYYNFIRDKLLVDYEWLRFYGHSKDNIINFEYGATKDKNFGFDLALNRTQFLAKVKHYTSLGIYYKMKLYEQKQKVLSLQTKVFIEDHYVRPQEYYMEWGILYGRSKKFRKIETFIDSNVKIAGCLAASCRDRGWISFASTEGLKLPYGFILSNYNQYQIWFHDENKEFVTFENSKNVEISGYRITPKFTSIFYEQISLAKNINFFNLSKNEFYLQFSYFLKTNLARPKLIIKGIKISAWLEI